MHNAMEQTRFWMWTRRKSGERPLFGSSIQKIASGSPCKESWEEKAFAVDSAGHLGGCVWPPRSYSCSFCRREFRSAQALGGHMNVHRRERARLKQSSSPASESHDTNQHHHHGTCTPLGTWSLDQAGSPACKSNPNPIYCGVIASVLSPKLSAASTRENSESSLVSPPYSSTIIQENPMKSLSTATRSLAYPTTSRQLNLPEFKLGRESLKLREVGLRASRNPSDDEETISSKRRQRTDPWFPFLEGASSDGQQKLHSEVLKFSPCPDEEIDLELRLGHSANDK